jgi:hypothetical protein
MSDLIDKRGGAYDPVTPFGNPQPPQGQGDPAPESAVGRRRAARAAARTG